MAGLSAGVQGATDAVCRYERAGDRWRCLGESGGSFEGRVPRRGMPSAAQARPAGMMAGLSGCASRSWADREAQDDPADPTRVGWVACAMFRVAAEVVVVQAGPRHIAVPAHGYVIVAWKAPPASGSLGRPPIAALGADGCRLSELGPGDRLDSHTWAAIEALIGGD